MINHLYTNVNNITKCQPSQIKNFRILNYLKPKHYTFNMILIFFFFLVKQMDRSNMVNNAFYRFTIILGTSIKVFIHSNKTI